MYKNLRHVFGEGDSDVTIVNIWQPPYRISRFNYAEEFFMVSKQKILIVNDDNNIAELYLPLSYARMF